MNFWLVMCEFIIWGLFVINCEFYINFFSCLVGFGVWFVLLVVKVWEYGDFNGI